MTHFSWRYLGTVPLQLGTFLFRRGVTRTLMKKIKFHGGLMEVNYRHRRTNYNLSHNDLVDLYLPPEPSNPNVLVSNVPVDVVYENRNYLVVNKPAGISSVPSKKYSNDTLINRVKGYYYRKHYSNLEMHIVTRLDRVTSGLVIFAKNHFAHSILDRQLKSDLIDKEYLVVVNGRLSIKSGAIVLPLARDPYSLIKRRVSASGKYAKTRFRVLKTTPYLTFLKVKLDTGRTHQIRVHFSAIGHPVVGDWLYNSHSWQLNRLALHCAKLRFYDPLDREWVTCTSSLPLSIRVLINQN